MSLLVFEDERVDWLDPIAVAQPAFAIGCGGYRLIDLLPRLAQPTRHLVRPHLRAIQQADFPDLGTERDDGSRPLLLVNARLVPSADSAAELLRLWTEGRPGIVHHGEHVAVALLAPPQRMALGAPLDARALAAALAKLALPLLAAKLSMLEYPHDVIRYHQATLGANLSERITGGGYREAADGVYLAPGASLGQYVVTETREGPIVLEADAQVGAHSYLSGPIHLGPRARVAEHSVVRRNVALGHTAKLGGEASDTIVEPYSNKQHFGFIGHSYLGRWVNLGAGTTTSNLKNTYGQVNMEYGGRKVPTGMQFLGCIVGDYARSAINTAIFSGKTIGACSMLYGFVTTNVPAFVNYARSFGQYSELTPQVMIATQGRIFARRDIQQRPCDIELIQAMFRLTEPQRSQSGMNLTDQPLSL